MSCMPLLFSSIRRLSETFIITSLSTYHMSYSDHAVLELLPVWPTCRSGLKNGKKSDRAEVHLPFVGYMLPILLMEMRIIFHCHVLFCCEWSCGPRGSWRGGWVGQGLPVGRRPLRGLTNGRPNISPYCNQFSQKESDGKHSLWCVHHQALRHVCNILEGQRAWGKIIQTRSERVTLEYMIACFPTWHM